MTDGPRIFVDEDPTPPGSGPWMLVAIVALIVATSAFVISVRQPSDDRAVIELPLPPTSTTTTTTVPTTTTTELAPRLRLETLVPAFDRTVHFVSVDDGGMSITSWTRGRDPLTHEHAIGAVQWAGLDAAGASLGAITAGRNGQSVLWLGTPDLVEPAQVEEGPMSAVFHVTNPGWLAVSTFDGVETVITTRPTWSDGADPIGVQLSIEGDHTLVSWSDAGFLVVDADEPVQAIWIGTTGAATEVDGFAPAVTGLPIIYAPNFTGRSTLIEDRIEPLPDNTVSLSPGGRYAVISTPLQYLFADLERDLQLPLLDPPGQAAGWSLDQAWLVYVSGIDSFRREVLSRFVFVDVNAGSTVSISVPESQLGRPLLIAVGP